MFGTAAVASFIKIIPWLIGMRIATGIIDVGVHTIKLKISNKVK